MKLKVVTLNIWQGRRLDKAIEFLRGEDGDVVMIQEAVQDEVVYESGIELETFERLKQALGIEARFVPMWKFETEKGVTEMGLTVFSKFSIKSTEAEFYYKGLLEMGTGPQVRSNFPGLALHVEVETEVGTLRFITTHFVWSKYPEVTDLQLEAAGNLQKYLDRFDEFVFAGDLNTTDDSKIYETISRNLVDDRPKGLNNTLHPTIHKLKGSKKLAVDYIFHRGGRFKLVESRVPVVDAADHLPVVAVYDVS